MGEKFKFLRSRKRAVILVLSLWIAIILSIMAYSIAYEVRINLRLAHQSQAVMNARALARAGVAKAVSDLRNDKLLAIADPTQKLTDSYKDVWGLSDDKTDVKLGEGTYTVRVEDEEGKLNLTGLTPQNAPVFAYLLNKICEVDPIKASIMALMVVDYQDADIKPSTGQGENEIDFYTQWVHENFKDEVPEDWVFEPRNDLMMNLEELLRFPGMTRMLLYGDPEEIDRRKPRDIDRLEDESKILSDYVTVVGGRALNINTVSTTLLEGLFKAALPNATVAEDLAQKVTKYRITLARNEGTRGTILSLAQLQEAGVPRQEQVQIGTIIPLYVASSFYTITSRGEYKGISKTIQVRVNVNVESFQVNLKEPDTFGLRDRRASGSLKHRTENVIDPAVRVIEMKEL